MKKGIYTGLKEFDLKLGGLHKKELVLIGARPSQGKTAMAARILYGACVENGAAGLAFSLEMDKSRFLNRLAYLKAKIPVSKPRSGPLTTQEEERLAKELSLISNAQIFVNDTTGLEAEEICAKTRETIKDLKEKGRALDLMLIDYAQLIRGPVPPKTAIYIYDAAIALKALAVELDICVVLFSQMSRGDSPPALSDFRPESLSEYADKVFIIRRDRNINSVLNAVLSVAKNNNGLTGDIDLKFFSEYAAFENASDKY